MYKIKEWVANLHSNLSIHSVSSHILSPICRGRGRSVGSGSLLRWVVRELVGFPATGTLTVARIRTRTTSATRLKSDIRLDLRSLKNLHFQDVHQLQILQVAQVYLLVLVILVLQELSTRRQALEVPLVLIFQENRDALATRMT